MAKARRVFVCEECGSEAPSWQGRCPGCAAWATMAEHERSSRPSRSSATGLSSNKAVRPLDSIDIELSLPFPVGVDEVDRVLGGGLAPGSATLLAGEPGIGKSTLMLQIAASVAQAGGTVLVVAGEEAPSQVAVRAHRLGPIPPSLLVVDDISTDAIAATIADRKPQLVVIDSIQTLRAPMVESAPGSVTQVKAAAGHLIDVAKSCEASLVMVGHVNKEGSIAGPRVLEHMVDTVMTFEGDRHSNLRFLRTTKHRFGPTSEVGIFDMTAEGLTVVPDPSDRYLQDRQPDLPGSVVVPALSGRRPFLTELQALVVPVQGRAGQTTVQGAAGRRVTVVAAVLASRAGYRLGSTDIFVSATGGVSVDEPAADLALALAIASAADGQPVSPDVVACGEIGLGGELRSVPLLELRLQEAFRMGFRTAVVPKSAPDGPTGLRLVRAETLGEALAAVPQQVVSRQ